MTSSVATIVWSLAGFTCLVTVVVCGVWTNEIYWKIAEKVNAPLPEGEKFKPLFWGPLKRVRLNDKYRRLFPEGSDLKQLHRLTAIMFAALVRSLILVIRGWPAFLTHSAPTLLVSRSRRIRLTFVIDGHVVRHGAAGGR